jgi:hypothetical protein
LKASDLFADGDVGVVEGGGGGEGFELFFGNEVVELVLELFGFVVENPIFIVVRLPQHICFFWGQEFEASMINIGNSA